MTTLIVLGSPAMAQDDSTCPDGVSQCYDLVVAVTVSETSPAVNQQVEYAITVTNIAEANRGPVAPSRAVAVQLPETVRLDGWSSSQAEFASGTWRWVRLNSGESAQLMLTVTVIATAEATTTARILDNSLNPSVPDTNLENDSDSVTINPIQTEVDLALTKSVDNPTPNVGDTVTYTLTVQHVGSQSDATGVVVAESIPATMTFVSATPSQGSYDPDAGVWNVGNLAGSATLTLDVTVDSPGEITNTAEITAVDQPDVGPFSDNDSVTITPIHADLVMDKTVDNNSPTVEDTISYTVSVANNGPNDATGVVVAEPIVTTMTFVSAMPSQGSYDPDAGTWDVGDLADGATAELTLDVTVDSPEEATNTAEITAADQYDADANNNTAAVTVTPIVVATTEPTAITSPGPISGNTIQTPETTEPPAATTEPPVPTTTEPTATTEPVATTEAPVVTTEAPATTEPAPPSVWVELPAIEPGQTQTGHARGFQPGEMVTAEQRSTPLSLGTQVADADGAVTFTWTIRADETVGEHQFFVSGELSGSASTTFEVAAPAPAAALPATGIDLDTMLLIAAAIAAYGLAIVIATSRWRTVPPLGDERPKMR